MERPISSTPSASAAATSRATVPRFLDNGARWAWRFVVIAAAIAVLVWLTARLTVVIIPVVVALVLSALLTPVVELFSRRVPRLLATWAVLLVAVASLVGIGFALSSPVADAADNVTSEFDTAVSDIEDWLQDGPLGLSADTVASLSDSVANVTDRVGSGLFDEPATTVRLAVEVIGGFFLMVVLLFFFLKDGPQMWSWMLSRIRPVRRATVDASGRAAIGSVQGWIRGVAITGVVDGVLIGGAMLILGVPAAVPIAVLTFAASFFPIVGATLAGALAVAIALTSNGVAEAVILGVVVLAVQQVEGDVILPMVMRRQVALHPIVILVSLAVGVALGGILGALVAVPLTAAVSAAVRAASGLTRPGDADDGELVIVDGGSIGSSPGTDST
jgi:predicted PurR-regulated permease PerM